MSISLRRVLIGVLAMGGFGLLQRVEGQPVQSPDVLSQLLMEVHGLRLAMEQAATSGPRVQLLTGRLQIEEGRIDQMVRRLDVVHDATAAAAREVGDLQAQSERLDKSDQTDMPQEERNQIEGMKPEIKRHLAQAQSKLDAAKAEETQLQADIASEQSRWTAISQQLDVLDRELSKR